MDGKTMQALGSSTEVTESHCLSMTGINMNVVSDDITPNNTIESFYNVTQKKKQSTYFECVPTKNFKTIIITHFHSSLFENLPRGTALNLLNVIDLFLCV